MSRFRRKKYNENINTQKTMNERNKSFKPPNFVSLLYGYKIINNSNKFGTLWGRGWWVDLSGLLA